MKRNRPLLLLLLLLCLLLAFLNFADYAIRMIIYPYEWDPGEGDHVYQSWRLIEGKPFYKDFSAYPMIVANYPPVFFSFCGLLSQADPLSFWPGRLISTVSALAIGWLIYLAIGRGTGSRFWSAAGALIFFASPSCGGYWLPMVRVDTLMLALSLAGLYFTDRARGSLSPGFLAVIFFLLAVYTKQNAVLFAAAALIWLFTVNRKRALLMGTLFLLLGGAIFIIIDRGTGGEFFRQAVRINAGRYQPGLMAHLSGFFFRRWLVFFAAAVAGFFAIVRRRENTVWAYFFVAALLHIPMTGRFGANLNYFLPPIAAIAIICGREGWRLNKFLAAKNPRLAGLTLLLIGVLGLLLANRTGYKRPTSPDILRMNEIRRELRGVEGDILLTQMHSLAFLEGKKVFIFPTSLGAICGQGYRGVDQDKILSDIARQRFAYVLDTHPGTHISIQIHRALLKYYDRKGELRMPNWRGNELFMVWEPKSEDDISPTKFLPGFSRTGDSRKDAADPEEKKTLERNIKTLPYLQGYHPAPPKTGVLRHDRRSASPGLNLYASGHAPQAYLIDLDGKVVHEWGVAYQDVWPEPLGDYVTDAEPTNWMKTHLFPNGDLLVIFGRLGLVRIDQESRPLWAWLGRPHHDLHVAENGLIYVLTHRWFAELEGVKLDQPILLDFITILSPEGEELERISILDSFLNSDYTPLVADLKEGGDFFHSNTIELNYFILRLLCLGARPGPSPWYVRGGEAVRGGYYKV